MSINPIEVEILLQVLPTITKIRYTALANTVIIVFDHLLTLDQEISLIWRADWSLGKVLFLINRYYALVPVVFNNFVLFSPSNFANDFCSRWVQWQGATGILLFVVAESILLLRLYAMYFRDKRMLVAISVVGAGAAASSIYIMTRALQSIGAVALHISLDNTTVCVPTGIPTNFWAFWIPMLISESFYCLCAVLRGVRSWRRGETIVQSGRQLIHILIRDSVYYFLIIFAAYLTNAIIFLTSPSAEIEIPIGFAQSLSCVMSSRLCLNVRGFIREQNSQGMISSPPISPVTGPGASRAYVSFGDVGTTASHSDGMFGSHDPSAKMLTEVELRELRSMRAYTPAHAHVRHNSRGHHHDMLHIK